MGDGGAQDRQMEHPGQLQVVGETATAAHQAPVLLAQHPAVSEGGRLHLVPLHAELDHGASSGTSSACSAAQRTDRTMVA